MSLAFPAIGVVAEAIGLAVPESRFASPLAGTAQFLIHPGARWQLTVTTQPLVTEDDWRAMDAMLAAHAATREPIAYALQARAAPWGTADPATPLQAFADAASGATTVEVGPLLAGQTLKAGSFLTITSAGRPWLYQLVADVTGAGATGVVWTVRPNLRRAVTTGDAVAIGDPLIWCRVAGAVPSVNIAGARQGEPVTLQLDEALP